MRAAIAIVALCACGGREHPRRVQAHADPRWFCGALYRGDLATASDAAASWIERTGTVPSADNLRGWLDALPCVVKTELRPCSRSRLDIQLQAWLHRRTSVAAYVGTDGRVKLVDATWLVDECEFVD